MPRENEFGQPIGDPLPADWSRPPHPPRQVLEGVRVRLEPLDPDQHADDLWKANQLDQTGAGWTYMPYGPFDKFATLRAWMERDCRGDDPLYFAYVAQSSGEAIGWGSYMRINVRDGSIEVGSIRMSPLLQRTPMATEAMHLMMKNAFALGYRRYEWKCDALNAPSRRAAERLGFVFEGIFRKATHYKGRSRDTAWFAIVDSDWPAIDAAQSAWLDPDNFDPDGVQRRGLSAFIAEARR